MPCWSAATISRMTYCARSANKAMSSASCSAVPESPAISISSWHVSLRFVSAMPNITAIMPWPSIRSRCCSNSFARSDNSIRMSRRATGHGQGATVCSLPAAAWVLSGWAALALPWPALPAPSAWKLPRGIHMCLPSILNGLVPFRSTISMSLLKPVMLFPSICR